MWRFKTKEEFIIEGRWLNEYGMEFPKWWNDKEEMNDYLGRNIPSKYHEYCEEGRRFNMDNWVFFSTDYIKKTINHLYEEETYEIY